MCRGYWKEIGSPDICFERYIKKGFMSLSDAELLKTVYIIVGPSLRYIVCVWGGGGVCVRECVRDREKLTASSA